MKSRNKNQPLAKRAKPRRLNSNSSQKSTREIIIEAAIQVFADHSYTAASIRIIANVAGIDHPLISYYFPTKAMLFKEVLKTITEEYYQANTDWFAGLNKLEPGSGLSVYLDRFFEFAIAHPKALRIIALNLVQAEGAKLIPGYRHIQNFFSRTMRTFTSSLPLQSSERDIEFFTHSFNTLSINYLAAGKYYAGILGLASGSPEYLKWVKDSLMFLFLPRLRQLISGGN